MLAAIGRFKLSIRFECGMITLCPIFENSAGSPVASLPKINEKRPFGRTSCKLHFASSINGYNSLSPYTFWYSSNESKYTKSVENIAPIDALTTFGSNASTAGRIIAIWFIPKPNALRMIVPMLPALDGLTRTIWFLCVESFDVNLWNSPIT